MKGVDITSNLESERLCRLALLKANQRLASDLSIFKPVERFHWALAKPGIPTTLFDFRNFF